MQEITLQFGSPFNYTPEGGRVVDSCGKILALGRWNLPMSQCKCPGVPWGQPPGMAADKCITNTRMLQIDRNRSSETKRLLDNT